MRLAFLPAITAVALALAGCGGTKETYPMAVSDAFSKVSSGGYAAGGFALPGVLSAMDVGVSFQAFPDRTANWKFTHKGKELARVEASVEGDTESSTVSYSFVPGEAAGEFPKLASAIDSYSRKLLLEGMDAQLDGRPMEVAMKEDANAQLARAMIGDMMQSAAKAMEVTPEQRATWDRQDREHEERVARMSDERIREYSSQATQPSVQLSR